METKWENSDSEGTNKLKCQKNIPTGSHLTQMSAEVPNLDDFWNLNNFGQNGQN